jgi:hypothetical protein
MEEEISLILTARSITSTDIRTSKTLRRFIATPQTPTKNNKVELISTRPGDTKVTMMLKGNYKKIMGLGI